MGLLCYRVASVKKKFKKKKKQKERKNTSTISANIYKMLPLSSPSMKIPRCDNRCSMYRVSVFLWVSVSFMEGKVR